MEAKQTTGCSLLTLALVLILSSNTDSLDANTGNEVCGGGLTCRNNGRCRDVSQCMCMEGWTGRECTQRITCPELSTLLVNVELPEVYSRDVGSVVWYTCKHGFQFVGAVSDDNLYKRMLLCNQDGVWSPELTDCVALCPAVATWRGYLVDSTRRTAGSSIRYDCYGFYPSYHQDAGKVMFVFRGGDIGEQEATCSSTGQWIQPIVECIDVDDLKGSAAVYRWNALLIVAASLLLLNACDI